ncbi:MULTISPECIES: hypothetical protein [unclassified Brevundimonas]|uniref:hypothetical protein n=1 Tax=unclassified Brevundimonas TaxID=2622653 RepID=UPI0025BCA6CD|nr:MULTISPECIES: hypothetical protein [unclassified Brevundimonas]
MNQSKLIPALALAVLVTASVPGSVGAQSATGADPCSNGGGYPEGSPGTLMSRLRGLSSGSYSACAEARRREQPRRDFRGADREIAARRAVELQLSQPSSAQFRNVRRRQIVAGVATYCGEVSALNRAGGRSAFVRFEASVPDRGEASARLDSEQGQMGQYFEAVWRNYCAPGGEPVIF